MIKSQIYQVKILFDLKIDEAYQSLSKVSNKNGFRFSFEGYEHHFNQMIFVNVCEEYIMAKPGAVCELEILNSGIQTISIYVLENARKLLARYPAFDLDSSKEILNSEDMALLGKHCHPYR